MSKLHVALATLLLVAAACDGTSPESTTTVPDVVSTTGQTVPTSSTTVPASTSSTSSDLSIMLAGARLVYSVDGTVVVSGWVDRPVDVTVDGASALTHTDPDGRTGFTSDLTLEPGEHVIEVVAVDQTGAQATESLNAIVDPDLQEELAYIQDLVPSENTLVADYVQWLTGEEAVTAAREDGYVGADEDLPGEFYVRNENPRLRTLTLDANTMVTVIACYLDANGPCVTEEAVDIATWSTLTQQPENAVNTVGWQWYGNGELPYWLTLRDGIIIQVHEHYLP